MSGTQSTEGRQGARVHTVIATLTALITATGATVGLLRETGVIGRDAAAPRTASPATGPSRAPSATPTTTATPSAGESPWQSPAPTDTPSPSPFPSPSPTPSATQAPGLHLP
jgi:hypothetical protein